MGKLIIYTVLWYCTIIQKTFLSFFHGYNWAQQKIKTERCKKERLLELMTHAIKYGNTDGLLAPFATKLYCLILTLPPSSQPQKFMKCDAMQPDPGWTRGSWPSKAPRSAPLPPPPRPPALSSLTYLSRSSVRDYRHTRAAPEHKPAQQENEGWVQFVQEWMVIIYRYLLHLYDCFKCARRVWY